MFKNRNYNNVSQKRLAKFALIKYHINFWNYSIYAVILFMRIMRVVVRAHKQELAKINDFTNVDWPGI